ncbi:hypothetical protein FH972_015001 [Carpinus fangiana]|uniref:Uncharacterized protein n=1 Tax=Carpinus fangiana TaxID=176857 RepID=A0A5N6RCG5_9ROSI|nr:hypothetical protein FH972_015001 [Carpinus fangiana]
MKEFPVPKPRTIERFETAHGIKPIVAWPIATWPIAAWPLDMVPSKPMTSSSFELEEDYLVDVSEQAVPEIPRSTPPCQDAKHASPSREAENASPSHQEAENAEASGPTKARASSLPPDLNVKASAHT